MDAGKKAIKNKEREREICYAPEDFTPHWFPYISEPYYHQGWKFKDELFRQLRAAFAELAENVSKEAPGEITRYDGKKLIEGCDRGSDRFPYMFPVGFAEKFQALFTLTVECIKRAAENGKQEGLSTIRGLASGEISMNKLNEITMRKEK